MWGALASLEVVWGVGDLFMAVLTLCNLIAIIRLSRHVFRLLADYRKQKSEGKKEPVFHRDKMPEIAKDIECWDE